MPTAWDTRHEAVIHHWTDLRRVKVQPDDSLPSRARHILQASGEPHDTYNVDALYVPGSSDALIVAFHGALVREHVDLPRFEWLGALRHRREHRLFIADTTLAKSQALTLGWYLGSECDDLAVKVARFINHVREQLGVTKTILLGSSGGGFAALAIAPAVDHSSAVAFSPQTNVWEFSRGHTRNLLATSFPGYESEEDLHERFPERFSLIERYKAPNRRNRFTYVQNSGDTEHFERHFAPFSASLGVSGHNGRTTDKSGLFISTFYGAGHAPPPRERLDEFVDMSLSDLDESI